MSFFRWYAGKLKESYLKLSDMKLLSKKCPKCDSTNINTVKANQTMRAFKDLATIAFPIAILFRKTAKPLNVCKSCGFSWEDR